MRTKPLNSNSMTMIMENFRRYAEQTSDCGPLCLFEDGTPKEVSFYDHIYQLNESDEAVELFLENWEKSADYQLQKLNEGDDDYYRKLGLSDEDIAIYQDMRRDPPATADMTPEQRRIVDLVDKGQFKSDPVLYLQVQSFVALDRFKDKAAKMVLKVITKIKGALAGFKSRHPNLYEFAVAGLIALAFICVAFVLYKLINSGGDAEVLTDLTQQTETVPEVSQALENITNATSPEQGMDALQTFDESARASLEALPGFAPPEAASSPDSGVGDVIKQAWDTLPEPPARDDQLSFMDDMFAKLGQDPVDLPTGDLPSGAYDPSLKDMTTGFKQLAQQMEQTLKPEQIDDLINQLEAGDLKRSGRRALRQLYRADLEPSAKYELDPVVAWTNKGGMPGLNVWIDDLRKSLSG